MGRIEPRGVLAAANRWRSLTLWVRERRAEGPYSNRGPPGTPRWLLDLWWCGRPRGHASTRRTGCRAAVIARLKSKQLLLFANSSNYSLFKRAVAAVCLRVAVRTSTGGGPGVVVSTAAFHTRVRGSVPGLGGLKETKKCESQYCWEPLWPRGSVLGLRPPGHELRILCLEDSVISIISPSSGGSPGPV